MIRKIFLVFKTHFDIGFTDLAEHVIRGYGHQMLREVIETCRATEDMGSLRYVWTMPAWPLKYILEHGDPELLPELRHYIDNGQIVWHALPFTSHTDCCAPEEYVAALGISRELAERFGRPCPVSGKMTDVPGHGLMLPELLSCAGIRFLHLGCNEFAMPPAVPRLFWWESPQGGRVLTMYSKGGYGTSLLPPDDWEFPVWMALMQTLDNCGPQSADMIAQMVAKIRRVYPEVEVVCGSMDDFYHELAQCDLSGVEVVRKDLADTWIHGVGSYPAEVAQLRANRRRARMLHSAYAARLRSGGAPVEDWNALWSVYDEQTALFEEHTWGADVKSFLGPDRVYEKEEFLKARMTEPYRFMERSWDEQRGRMLKARAALDRIAAVLPGAEAEPDRLHSLCCDKTGDVWSVQSPDYVMQLNARTGMIESVTDRRLGRVILKSRDGRGVFSYRYDVAGIEEIQTFLRRYGYRFTDWGILDYGRSHYPECGHVTGIPRPDTCQVESDRVVLHYTGTETAGSYGDCQGVTVSVSFPEDGSILVDLALEGKQASPFIEAGSLIIPLAEADTYRLGRPMAFVDPARGIEYQANHSYYCLEDEVTALGGGTAVTVEPLDTPLLSIGASGLYCYEPAYPEGRAPELWFNLFNTMWGTNFPQWIEGSFRFRFRIRSSAADALTPVRGVPFARQAEGIPWPLEVVRTVQCGKGLLLLLRDHGGRAEQKTITWPHAALVETDILGRITGAPAEDALTITVRPYGVHSILVTPEEKGDRL